MSFRTDKFSNFVESDQVPHIDYLSGKSDQKIKQLFDDLLEEMVHGFCFSLYVEGQQPGDPISEEQIRWRMDTLKPHTKWIRTFSCTAGNELIPKIAREYGIKTLVGAWLGNDREKNEEEVAGLIELSNQGLVDITAVGNEVLYRKDLEECQLLEYIRSVKKEVKSIPVGYVDAYYEFADRPALTEMCDVVLCNCYPFWEATHFDNAFQHMRQMYHQAKKAANGKKVIITETGWPSEGAPLEDSIPSKENAMRYFINTIQWSKQQGVELFYFSSFDESWKTGDEGDVGACWGIWDSNGNLKF